MNGSFVRRVVGVCVVGGLLATSAVFAQEEAVSKKLHPNLAAAQNFIEKAVAKIDLAQKANEYDMDGHAAKAKVLLDKAYAELKLAAEAANVNKK
jgi:hypothetical protein